MRDGTVIKHHSIAWMEEVSVELLCKYSFIVACERFLWKKISVSTVPLKKQWIISTDALKICLIYFLVEQSI